MKFNFKYILKQLKEKIYIKKLFKEKMYLNKMDNHYQDKYEEFQRNIHTLMFTFEVTKCCGYSTFVTVYKNQTLIDLYSNIIQHFGDIEIKHLYFISPENERISVPISTQTVSDFVRKNIICNPIKLVPIYELPKPVVYRLFLNDGHCDENHCTTVHYANR
jgi:hypothetical protein